MATKKSLIFESKLLERTIEENRTNEKVERLKIARIERRKYSKQLISAEKKVVQQKEEKNELINNMILMEAKQNALTKELQNCKKALLTEEVTGKKVHKQVDLEKTRYYNEKEKWSDEKKKDTT